MFLLRNIHLEQSSDVISSDPSGGTESGGVTTSGLLGDYRVENYGGSGNILNDVSGNDYHLNITGTTYDSTDMYITGGTTGTQLNVAQSFTLNAYTIEGWFRWPSDLSTGFNSAIAVLGTKFGMKIRNNYGAKTPSGHGVSVSGGFSGGTTGGGPGITTNTWAHFAVTYDTSNNYRVYSGGSYQFGANTTNLGQNPVTDATNSIWITNDTSIQWGHVRFYNSALSASQILSNMTNSDSNNYY
jgi:hypothetical protein|tara:strand:+ start:842 stop:1567 length:726 start_codon:yes stop_codon:yes gene_type:complete